jgi:hypothetical protein
MIGAYSGEILYRFVWYMARNGAGWSSVEKEMTELQTCVLLLGVGWTHVVIRPTDADLLRMANHSCDPNCKMVLNPTNGYPVLFAARDIRADEELTWDYQAIANRPDEEIECDCGSDICRGKIAPFLQSPFDIAVARRLVSDACADSGTLSQSDRVFLIHRKFDGPAYLCAPDWALRWAASVLRLEADEGSVEEDLVRDTVLLINFVTSVAGRRGVPPGRDEDPGAVSVVFEKGRCVETSCARLYDAMVYYSQPDQDHVNLLN